jgi:hypothetical protein
MLARYEAGSALEGASAEVAARVTLLKGDSSKLNYTALHGTFGMVVVDGDHRYACT